MEKQLLNSIQKELELFSPISLEEMDEVSLMDRVDSKFVFSIYELPKLLSHCRQEYQCFVINNQHISDYKTDYYDKQDFKCFLDHHNGRANRYKIRYREYIGSKLSFLEIKFKNNKDKTFKSRIKAWNQFDISNEAEKKFVEENTPFEPSDIQHILSNEFSRITLVSVPRKERITIDLNLKFNINSASKDYTELCIAEVKQERFDRKSPIIHFLGSIESFNTNFSKYCIGVIGLYKNMKYNRFKSKMLLIDKISRHGRIVRNSVV